MFVYLRLIGIYATLPKRHFKDYLFIGIGFIFIRFNDLIILLVGRNTDQPCFMFKGFTSIKR